MKVNSEKRTHTSMSNMLRILRQGVGGLGMGLDAKACPCQTFPMGFWPGGDLVEPPEPDPGETGPIHRHTSHSSAATI